jgi:hypothetical protein
LAIIGLIFFICGAISFHFVHHFLGVNHPVNFLIAGNSFFLMSIASKLLCKCNRCCCKDDNCKCEKEEK